MPATRPAKRKPLRALLILDNFTGPAEGGGGGGGANDYLDVMIPIHVN